MKLSLYSSLYLRFQWMVIGVSLAHSCHAELGARPTEPLSAGLNLTHLELKTINDLYNVQEITLDGGTQVREYLNTSGQVFGVTWQGPFKPDLNLFLGERALKQLRSEAVTKMVDHHHTSLHTRDLIIISRGMGRQFSGKALAPLLAPSSVGIDQIQ
jgi:Protein of unknown function (DUF2844)